MKIINYKSFLSVLLIGFLLGGCAASNQSQTSTQNDEYASTKQGALIGGILGAVIGGVAKKDDKKKGILLGGAIGAAVGGGIGYSMDQQAKEVAKELETEVNNNPNAAADPDNDIIVSNTDKYVKIMLRDTMVFETNSSIPTPEASLKIEKITNVLRKYPDTLVQVVGFTDSRGTYEYNQRLSEKRAETVGNRFYNSGISNKIFSRGCSYNKPVVVNTTPENMALNRRVEIYLYADANNIIDSCKE